jgi:hypothetical protein
LIEHAEWFYRKGRPECSTCIELKAENNRTPDCTACGFVKLEPENFLVMYFIQNYSGFFISGDGSVNPSGLRLAMDLEDIEPELRPELCELITLYLCKALRAQRGDIETDNFKVTKNIIKR